MTHPASAAPQPSRASADLLIDRQRLSELLGREVRATRLRFKPGLSTTAVLLDAEGDDAPGWIQVGHPAHRDKLRNAVELAQERGQRVHLHEADGLFIAHGTIDTDPRLQKGLDSLRSTHTSVTEAVNAGQLRVLRYNPQRRLVLRRDVPHEDALVLRVTARRQHGTRSSLGAIAAAGVPVVEPLHSQPRPRSTRVSVWPWFGHGDLASLTSAPGEPARAAGVALARLHAAQVPALTGAGPGAGSGLFAPVPEPVEALAALVRDLVPLDVAAAQRMRTVVSHVAEAIAGSTWETGLTHGDFSADQVLVGRPGEDTVRLTDFDRAGHGPLVADLGSFAAAERLGTNVSGTPAPGTPAPGTPGSGAPASAGSRSLETLPLTRDMLAGYAEAGGPARHQADHGGLRIWTARALLARILEPFRTADPDWVIGIHHRLDQVQEVLP